MFWKIVMVLGTLGVLLGLAVTGISVALPIVNGPRTSWEEAMYGIVPGSVVFVFSFFVFLIGFVFVIRNRRKKLPATAPGPFGSQ